MHLRRFFLAIGLLLCGVALRAQTFDYRGGAFAIGLRTTGNVFLDDGMMGMGAGGQWKLGFGRRVNTEWFLDYITSRGKGTAYRNDYHIGWSVQFALNEGGFNSSRFTPYILGGQCFDLTRVGHFDWMSSPLVFSGAAQAGVGLSHFIGKRMELNLQLQYMVHLGKDVHIDEDPLSFTGYHIHRGVDFKGHILSNISMNFYLFHVWKGK